MHKKDMTLHRQLIAIGAQVRRLRKESGFSQEGFALHAGLPRAYMGQVERGERNLSVANLIRIAAGLGVELGALFPPLAHLAGGAAVVPEANVTAENSGRGNDAPLVRSEPAQGVKAEGTKEEEATFLSTGAAARRFGLSTRTLQRWAESGAIPARFVEDKRGKRYAVFHPDDVARMAAQLQKMRSRDPVIGLGHNVANSSADGS